MRDQPTGESDSLGLSSRELSGTSPFEAVKFKSREQLSRLSERVIATKSAEQEGKCDVLFSGQFWHKLPELEDETKRLTTQFAALFVVECVDALTRK
jgi:hypothetical protein